MNFNSLNMLEIIRQAFKKTITTEFQRNKIWYTEEDLIGVFYHLIRPVIDLMPNYEICWEWTAKLPNGNVRIDLVIAEMNYIAEEMTIDAFPRIMIEFKWGYKDKKGAIEKDAQKLTKLLDEDCSNGILDLGDKVKRINKGNKPNHAFLFIADASYEEDRLEMELFYQELKIQFPQVEIQWEYPLKHNIIYPDRN